MDSKQAVLIVTVCAVISDILNWIMTSGQHPVNRRRGFETKQLENVFVITDELEEMRGKGPIEHHFMISAMGNPHQYPVDIVELECRSDWNGSYGGLFIKFNGGSVPIVLNPASLIMDSNDINALITAIVGSNKDLLALLEFNPGGKHAAKRTRK